MLGPDRPKATGEPASPPRRRCEEWQHTVVMLWDISPPVDPHFPVFPGDTPMSLRHTWTLGPDCPVNVTEITTTTHLGAHADAPLHFTAGGASVGELDLAPFLGPCRVVHALDAGAWVTLDLLDRALDGAPPRILVRTWRKFPTAWTADFAAWDPAVVDALAARGVVLIGTDAASIDPAESKTLDAHRAVARHDLRLLENLRLDDVPAGDYELIALPLRLLGADASPVRAVLRELT